MCIHPKVEDTNWQQLAFDQAQVIAELRLRVAELDAEIERLKSELRRFQ